MKTGISVNVNFPDQQTGRSTHDATLDVTPYYSGVRLSLVSGSFLKVDIDLSDEDIERIEAALARRRRQTLAQAGA
jgi:hypothetical protein